MGTVNFNLSEQNPVLDWMKDNLVNMRYPATSYCSSQAGVNTEVQMTSAGANEAKVGKVQF